MESKTDSTVEAPLHKFDMEFMAQECPYHCCIFQTIEIRESCRWSVWSLFIKPLFVDLNLKMGRCEHGFAITFYATAI